LNTPTERIFEESIAVDVFLHLTQISNIFKTGFWLNEIPI